ncbi:MAG: hypothetical protein Q9N67_09360 [Ghiorsea sp.]|nr:hypothetical protein [Ghiorsea sp.]
MVHNVACPECTVMGSPVTVQTIIHHVQQPWLWQKDQQDEAWDYYFCASQGCTTVYFSSQAQIKQDELRLEVGVKSSNEDTLICYCFDVSRKNASHPDIKAYVIGQTKAKQCACSVRNPSGRCCIKNFT